MRSLINRRVGAAPLLTLAVSLVSCGRTQIGLGAPAGDAGTPGLSQDGSPGRDAYPSIDGFTGETRPQVTALDAGTRLIRPLTNLEYDY